MGRKPQREKKCKTKGCANWCTCNDLCAKCNIAKKRYGSVYGKKVYKRKCKTCGISFPSKRDDAAFCSRKCYRDDPENKKKQYDYHKDFKERQEESSINQ